MSADEAAAWVEIIKAIGQALSVIIGAIGLVYGRLGYKAAKQAKAQTATQQFVGGELVSKPTAVTAEQALAEAVKASTAVQALLEREQLRGGGSRRLPTQDLSAAVVPAPQPAGPTTPSVPADTAMIQRLAAGGGS